jgi:hypothetical protein
MPQKSEVLGYFAADAANSLLKGKAINAIKQACQQHALLHVNATL